MADCVVELDATVYSLVAVNAAAYRLMDVANCQIDRIGNQYLCRLILKPSAKADVEQVRSQFTDYLTDENLREQIATKTDPVRNLILSLAFGSLASSASSAAE
jgi:His-Xaa-Ser system protein HxsD